MMDKRDYFAALALQALIAKHPFRDALDEELDDPECAEAAIREMRLHMAVSAYAYADAMIAASAIPAGQPVEVKYNYGVIRFDETTPSPSFIGGGPSSGEGIISCGGDSHD